MQNKGEKTHKPMTFLFSYFSFLDFFFFYVCPATFCIFSGKNNERRKKNDEERNDVKTNLHYLEMIKRFLKLLKSRNLVSIGI